MTTLRAPVLRNAWFVVALLCIVALLNYMDRLMLTTMRDPIRASIPMTDAQFGLLTSIFLWVYAVISPFGGFLADRIARRRIILFSLFFWSLATFATGFARSFPQLLSARALMGISEACYIPAGLALIADYHPGPTRSLATGLHMVGLYTGAALGGLGGLLSQYIPWTLAFQLFGLIGVFYGLFLVFVLHDAPTSPNTAPSQLKPHLPTALHSLFSRPAFLILLSLNILIGTVNWAIYGWMPTFLRQHFHLGLGKAGFSATAYIQVASFIGVLLAGAAADRWSRTRPGARALVPAITFLAAAPCLFVTGSTTLLPIAIAGLVIYGLSRGAIDSNQMPLLRQLIDERYSATGYGLINFVSTTAGGVMVYAGGAIMDAHVDLGVIFQICGAGLLLAGLLLWLVQRIGIPRHPIASI